MLFDLRADPWEMKRSTLLYTATIIIAIGGWLMGGTGQAQTQPEASPPNIILLADDLGYGDLSCYGSQSVETPHLDSLAAQGMRFSHFYAGSAVCSPSRASLLTGRYPLRYNIRRHFSDRYEHLPTAATTLPELLRRQGYHTPHAGKWHLGGLRPQDYARILSVRSTWLIYATAICQNGYCSMPW